MSRLWLHILHRFGKLDQIIQLDTLPENYQEMLSIAERLTAEFDYIRIDLYSIENKVYFSECTPYPAGGLDKINPSSYEKLWGELWKLPRWRDRHSRDLVIPGNQINPPQSDTV